MRLHFVPDLHGSPWTGPQPDASFGEAWVGPLDLVERFETALGLGAPYETQTMRAAGLVAAARTTSGFWSASAEVDPLAVARTLLSWRDSLAMQGWRGQPLTPRLEELAAVTAEVEPGLPDRIRAVTRALDQHSTDIQSIRLVEALETLPPLLRQMLEQAERRGTRVELSPPAVEPASGDLRRARRDGFTPRGDGTLELVRPPGPLRGADEVAAWLAAQPSLEGTLIIQPDSLLDRALHRYGLPATGSRDASDNNLLQLLPLVLTLGWSPTDPARALELLTLPVSPFPPSLARGLARSLHEWPAVGSDAWRRAMADGLAAIEPAERLRRVSERLDVLLRADAPGERFPADAARRRVDMLLAWLGARRELARQTGPGSSEAWDAAIAQCRAFRRLLSSSGLTDLSRPLIHRLLEDALLAAPRLARFSRQAGLGAVDGPSAVLGPARCIVWWSFDRTRVPSVRRLPLSPAERAALAEAGCPLPDPGRVALSLATRWQRPLLMASERLLLVCPERADDGQPLYPHLLWDELVARMADGTAAASLTSHRPTLPPCPPRRRRAHLILPEPRRNWAVSPERIHPRGYESPTSLSSLVGCSFQWAVRYLGKVYGGVTTALPHAERLMGSVAHEVLSRVLDDGLEQDADAAAARAVALFEAEGPRLAAALFWPGAEPARAQARSVIESAARELFRQIQAAGLQVVLVETEVERTALGTLLRGTPDVVLGQPSAVVDLKSGGARYRRDQLRSGTAYQLAAYAHLLRASEDTPYPAVAYFILRDQRLLTTARDAFPEGEIVDGALPDSTWRALEAAHGSAWSLAAEGHFAAPANPDERGVVTAPDDGIDEAGRLTLAPPCKFCEYKPLCGLAFFDEEADGGY